MNRIFYILCFVLIGVDLFANVHSDEDLQRIKGRWDRLMPKQSKLQFAGSMGMFSVGPGWYYGKYNQWETDWFIGFIPKMNSREAHLTTTLKQTYSPFKIAVDERFLIEPITASIYINKIFGQYFWSKLPEKYPKDYYFWAVNTRFSISVGQVFSYKLGDKFFGKDLSIFYEFNTNDLYVISAIGNKTIKFKDILGLSFGIRYRVF